MRLYFAAFTGEGAALGVRLARGLALAGDACRLFAPARFAGAEAEAFSGPLAAWAREAFAQADGLIFVGACGIAVRAVAPLLRGKDRDPAVVAVDQKGRFAVPLLSGHLGGANRLAERIAALCGAVPVITAGTDVCGLFAVDAWAAEHGTEVLDVELIKTVSGRLLAGEPVGLSCAFPMDALPEGFLDGPRCAGVSISLDDTARPFPVTLRLVPRIACLGIGCRRGVPPETLEARALALLRQVRVSLRALEAVCTIDLKADEPALLAFCEKYRLPLRCFSAGELMELEGVFTPSSFVASVTGADNVCERAAMLGCVPGRLLCPKTAADGVTAALAVREWKAVFYPEE